MYLHLGQDVLIKKSDIIGIFDMDKATVSKRTRMFLEAKQKENKVINAATDIPKSFIVCNWGMDVVVYISQISAPTLLKRCNYVKKISYI
ncbi:MAG: DUF370 domain-containing protein [Clostridia bacterium]|nr:DUF370 domain-containing protein [Clostridia bacterium]